jgi:hypothetical protein
MKDGNLTDMKQKTVEPSMVEKRPRKREILNRLESSHGHAPEMTVARRRLWSRRRTNPQITRCRPSCLLDKTTIQKLASTVWHPHRQCLI